MIALALLGTLILTPNFHTPLRLLHDFLKAREYNDANPQAHGLNAFALEGDTSLGKTHFLRGVLTSMGYAPVEMTAIESTAIDPQKQYYYLEAGLPWYHKEAIILKAFHEGSIVVMEEMNAAAFSERCLNAVLSGKDLQGNPAENTGFRLLVTQNPASTYEGRQDYSPALERRFLTYELPNYSETDLQYIAAKKGFKGNEIDDIIEEFLDAQTIQKAQLSEDVITFNDFIDELDACKPRQKARFWKPHLPQEDTHNSTDSVLSPTGVDLCL